MGGPEVPATQPDQAEQQRIQVVPAEPEPDWNWHDAPFVGLYGLMFTGICAVVAAMITVRAKNRWFHVPGTGFGKRYHTDVREE